ncbi:NADPH dependent diflavin oxidoreductase-like protein 1 [Tothia fuscella]|uniref:NADPH-dependent diflavin oxidoreductase 1 n=1 Tax=Tothia fuscella TaxID=1048955 RepID=A0A9P4NGM9_9PEZI|nr:NADPH dependent diflavin oxidoreductase-like protein 1 [Tothia fuscella]
MALSIERTALVLYGSETGNAQDVAEELGRLCERLHFTTQILDMNSASLKQLLQSDLVIFAISTTGQGDLPANSQILWRSLRSARLPPNCLQNLRFASFGLGDTSYPKYNWAHRKLYNRLFQLGAQPVCDRGESDEQHPEGIDGAFIPWALQLRQHLLQNYPLPEGTSPIPDDVLLEPKWILAFADGQSLKAANDQNGTSEPSLEEKIPESPPDDLLQIPSGITAAVLQNNRVTPPTHWQDVRHLTFSLSEQKSYSPGDVLTIYPKNFPIDVHQLLTLQNWTSISNLSLKFIPTQPLTPSCPPPPIAPNIPLTLKSLLTNHLDIMSIPRRSFFSHLSHYTADEFHIDRLKEFTNPEYIDELYDYTTRPRRSILEVLDEFTSVKLPWERICSIIPMVRGRQLSIASGGRLKQGDDGETTRVELLIAIVKYKTIIKRIREGVCTRYISTLTPGQNITVTLQKGGLNPRRADLEKPVIMIGPGTGVAPMRSLIYERQMWRQEKGLPKEDRNNSDTLFFGCRNAESDFFFKDEWPTLPNLNVLPAFSRDQRLKVYVQDLIRQHFKLVFTALVEKGGMVYICGSSGKMPQAVREALIETFGKEGGMEREDAEGYLGRMEREGRYKQETW